MRLFHSLLIMCIGSFVIQYYLMSILMTNNYKNITNSIGKFYLSVIMALLMSLLELMMYDYHNHTFSRNIYIYCGLLLVFFIYFYRNQVGINDKQYLAEMIEHHSMAVLTSNEILKKTDSYEVTKLANNIIQTQTDEINQMTNLLNKKNKVVRFG
jgi:hypothetical protein